MLSRILRTTIQGGLVCRNRCTTIFKGSFTKKLQSIEAPNFINSTIQSRLLSSQFPSLLTNCNSKNGSLFSPPTTPRVLNDLNTKIGLIDVPTRTVTKFSRTKGKRRTVKAVIRRFYRLNWGIWIRTIAGKDRRIWRKRRSRVMRGRRHVFTNSTQSWMLDKMVSKFWRKPKYWVDDPYNPYHQREEFWATRTKPLP